MITPSNQPLKANPFTTYRDPVTGRWIVVQTVSNFSPTDSICQPKSESHHESKLERIPTTSPPVVLTKKPISLSWSLVKYPGKKSAVNLTIPSLI